MFTSRIDGTRGEIWIPSLGILVAKLDRPSIIYRPEGTTPTVGQRDLQAGYSYLQTSLLDDEDFAKQWTVWIGRRPLKVVLHEDSRIEVIEHARNLRVEGVDIEWLQPDQ